ncbi:hypothetical protein R6Q59_024850 [Mikania micrantha]
MSLADNQFESYTMSGSNLMSGRNQYPYDSYNIHPGNGPPTLDPLILEQELEMQHHEIRSLLGENRRLVEDRIALQQELGAAREEFRRMNIAITQTQKENEMHSRQLIERQLKLEADIWAAEPLKDEVMHLHDQVKRLDSINHDLYGQVQLLKKDLAALQAENKQLPALRQAHEELHKELMHARDAIGYEKKRSTELLDQKQAMERNLVSMAREIEMLRAELFNPDSKLWGPDGSHRMNFGNHDSSFLHSYGDMYGHHMVAGENDPFFGSSSTPWAELEKSQMTDR